jgi:hypothetical protein
MGYLLDTNIISEVRKGPRCNVGVGAPLSGCATTEPEIVDVLPTDHDRGKKGLRPVSFGGSGEPGHVMPTF